MAATLTITRVAARGSVEPLRSGRGMEYIQIAGAATAAGDTGTYVCQTLQAPAFIADGAFKMSASGATITVTSIYALGTNTVVVPVIEAI